MLVDAVDAAVEAEVGLFGVGLEQLVLTIGIEEVELGLQGVGGVEAAGALGDIVLVRLAVAPLEGAGVVSGEQTEAALDPALEDGAFATVRIEGPAARHAQIVGVDAFLLGLAEAQTGFVQMIEEEVGADVVLKGVGAFRVLRDWRQPAEEVRMKVPDAVEFKRDRVALVGEAAQDHGRQVAVIDGKTGVGRERGGWRLFGLSVVVHTCLAALSGMPPNRQHP